MSPPVAAGLEAWLFCVWWECLARCCSEQGFAASVTSIFESCLSSCCHQENLLPCVIYCLCDYLPSGLEESMISSVSITSSAFLFVNSAPFFFTVGCKGVLVLYFQIVEFLMQMPWPYSHEINSHEKESKKMLCEKCIIKNRQATQLIYFLVLFVNVIFG